MGTSAKNNNVVYLKNNNPVKKNSAEIGIQANNEENNAVAVRQNSEKARNVFPTKSFLMGNLCRQYMMNAMYNKYMKQSQGLARGREMYKMAMNPMYRLLHQEKFNKMMNEIKRQSSNPSISQLV